MSVAHLDVAYPSLEAFHADCEECKVNGQSLLDVGEYFLTVYGFVVSIYHPNYRPEDNAPMDIRPTAEESQMATINHTNKPFWNGLCDEVGEMCQYPAGPEGLINYLRASADMARAYMMGEEL